MLKARNLALMIVCGYIGLLTIFFMIGWAFPTIPTFLAFFIVPHLFLVSGLILADKKLQKERGEGDVKCR